MRRAFALLLLVWLVGVTVPVQAQQYPGLSKVQRAEVDRFAANNSLVVLYHEMAHLLIHQLRLPVLGREEDAADNMATWFLLNIKNADADQVLADAARGWILSGIAYGDRLGDEDFAAPHSLDRQRALQIVCLMVGSDAKAFRRMANQYAIGRDRQDSCKGDYRLVDQSLQTLLGEKRSDSTPGTIVHVTYHDPGPALKSSASAFRRSGIFDSVAEELRQHYNIAIPVRFNARRCGEANAYYDRDTVEIIFCYELLQEYEMVYADELARSGPAGRSDSEQKSNSFRGPQ